MATDARDPLFSRRRFVRAVSIGSILLLEGCGRLSLREQPPTVRRLGVLTYGTPAASERDNAALRQGLRELAYDDRNLSLEYRGAEWQPERLPGLAAELVGQGVELIVAMGGDVARATMQATTTIPIVFSSSGDPVPGLVPSYSRPGGNATGVTLVSSLLAAKRLGLLKEILPAATRVAVLWQPTHADTDFAETQVAAGTLGVGLLSLEVGSPGDVEGAFDTARAWQAEALIVVAGRLTSVHEERIMALATEQRLPVISQRREYAEAGSLLAYGPSQADSYRRAAYYVDRILRGTKPADLPVEQPREFDFVINLKTAQALGLTIPQHVLLQATEVIQ
jgi:putative ABC transport system substrate-binding protein